MKLNDLIHKAIGLIVAAAFCVSVVGTGVSAKEEMYSPGNSFYKYSEGPNDFVPNSKYKYIYKNTTAKIACVKYNLVKTYNIDTELWDGFRDIFPYYDLRKDSKKYSIYELKITKRKTKKIKCSDCFYKPPHFKTQVKYKYNKNNNTFKLFLTQKAPFNFTVKVQDGNKKWYTAKFKKGSKKGKIFTGFRECKTHKQMYDRSRKKIVNAVRVIMPTSSENNKMKTHEFKAQYFEYRFISFTPDNYVVKRLDYRDNMGEYIYYYKGKNTDKYLKKLKKKYNRIIKKKKVFVGSLFTNDIPINRCVKFVGNKWWNETDITSTEIIDIAKKKLYDYSNYINNKGQLVKKLSGIYPNE